MPADLRRRGTVFAFAGDELIFLRFASLFRCRTTSHAKQWQGWVQIKSAYRRLIARPSNVALRFPPPPQHGCKRRRTSQGVPAPDTMANVTLSEYCPLPPGEDADANSLQRAGRYLAVG